MLSPAGTWCRGRLRDNYGNVKRALFVKDIASHAKMFNSSLQAEESPRGSYTVVWGGPIWFWKTTFCSFCSPGPVSVSPPLDCTRNVLHISLLLALQCAIISLLFKHCLSANIKVTCSQNYFWASGITSFSLHSICMLFCTYTITRSTPLDYKHISI